MAKRDPNVLIDPYASPDAAGPESSAPSASPGAPGVPLGPLYRASLPSHPAAQEGNARGSSPSSPTAGPVPAPVAPRVHDEPGPPTLPAKRRKRRGLALLVGTLIAAGVAGAGYLGYQFFLGRKPAPMFPSNDIAFLPESTVYVRRVATSTIGSGDFFFATPAPQAAWSHLAEQLCGGADVYRHLMSANLEGSRAVLVSALDVRYDTSKALTCGRDLAKKVGSTQYVVRIEGEREITRNEYPRRLRDEPPEEIKAEKPTLFTVTLYDVSANSLPETTKGFIERRDRSGLVDTHCAVESGRRFSDCWPGSQASAKLEGSSLWIGGRVAEVEAFGREFSPKSSNKIEEEGALRTLAEAVGKYPFAELGKWKAFDVNFIRRIGCGAPFTSWDSAPFNVKLVEAVTKFKSAWAIGDDIGQTGGEMRVLFLPETEGEAIDLVLDIKDWHDSAKEFFDKLEEPDMGGSEEVKATEREYRTAIHKSGVRTLGRAEVERTGKLVSLRFQSTIEDGEKGAIEDMKREVDDRAKAATKIVDQLILGERPSDDLLEELGGKELVDAVKHKNQPLKREF